MFRIPYWRGNALAVATVPAPRILSLSPADLLRMARTEEPCLVFCNVCAVPWWRDRLPLCGSPSDCLRADRIRLRSWSRLTLQNWTAVQRDLPPSEREDETGETWAEAMWYALRMRSARWWLAHASSEDGLGLGADPSWGCTHPWFMARWDIQWVPAYSHAESYSSSEFGEEDAWLSEWLNGELAPLTDALLSPWCEDALADLLGSGDYSGQIWD